MLFTEMTILTALRTAATSAGRRTKISGAQGRAQTWRPSATSAQSEFQAIAFKALLGVDRLRLYDIEKSAIRNQRGNTS